MSGHIKVKCNKPNIYFKFSVFGRNKGKTLGKFKECYTFYKYNYTKILKNNFISRPNSIYV